MSLTQSTRDAVRTEIQNQVREVVRVRNVGADQAPARAPEAPNAPASPDAPPAPGAPIVLSPIPEGGGRVIIDRQGDRTVVTSAALPPEVMPLVAMAQETALGLMGLLAAIFILGPFARMLARRMERTHEMKVTAAPTLVLQQQLEQLQQSVDAMSVEVERIGESQRFQSKLLVDRKSG